MTDWHSRLSLQNEDPPPRPAPEAVVQDHYPEEEGGKGVPAREGGQGVACLDDLGQQSGRPEVQRAAGF